MTTESNPASGADWVAGSSVASGTNDAKPSTAEATRNVWLNLAPACVHDHVTRFTPWNPGREHLMEVAELLARAYAAAFNFDVRAIGMAPQTPESGSLECRMVARFHGEPGFSAPFVRILEPEIGPELKRFRDLCGCSVAWDEPWADGAAE